MDWLKHKWYKKPEQLYFCVLCPAAEKSLNVFIHIQASCKTFTASVTMREKIIIWYYAVHLQTAKLWDFLFKKFYLNKTLAEINRY